MRLYEQEIATRSWLAGEARTDAVDLRTSSRAYASADSTYMCNSSGNQKRTGLKILLLGFLVSLFLSPWRAMCAPENVTIFVDGVVPQMFILDFLGTGEDIWRGAAPERESNYLTGSPLANVLAQKIPSRQEAVTWNGEVTDRGSVANAIEETKQKIRQAALANSRIDLITHSYGSVIAYAALAELNAVAKNHGTAPPAIANFVTLGSPLGQDTLLSWLGQKYPAVNIPSARALSSPDQLNIKGKWINLYASPDLVGGPITAPGVVNLPAGAVPNIDPSNPGVFLATALEAHKWPYLMPTDYGQVVNSLVDSHAELDRESEAQQKAQQGAEAQQREGEARQIYNDDLSDAQEKYKQAMSLAKERYDQAMSLAQKKYSQKMSMAQSAYNAAVSSAPGNSRVVAEAQRAYTKAEIAAQNAYTKEEFEAQKTYTKAEIAAQNAYKSEEVKGRRYSASRTAAQTAYEQAQVPAHDKYRAGKKAKEGLLSVFDIGLTVNDIVQAVVRGRFHPYLPFIICPPPDLVGCTYLSAQGGRSESYY
jgi:hypothetical protein